LEVYNYTAAAPSYSQFSAAFSNNQVTIPKLNKNLTAVILKSA